ncbi:MAG TPA: Rho termination factor N-terminal domain-containing protein [Solirubrobacterales bacterium]|nr:Rho termination factor N-terminal domain-containing protein [Solirubrobacterales bacterium]
MNKSELESKHLAELHELAADAGVERYRMLSRGELIEKLSVGGRGGNAPKPKGERRSDSGRGRQRDRKPRESRQREPRGDREPRSRESEPKAEREPKPKPAVTPAATPSPASASRPKRKRRRRRWGRRPKGIRIHDLLLPGSAGRQAIVYAESRAGCTALLREVAAELSEASKGPDPIALLVDPTPEELADWKREAPHAEIVSAGKAKHADDALAQARARAEGGEEVIVLIDSLSRFAEEFAGADEARELFDAGLGTATGTLTVVAAVERPS